ncbi:hypothetical protein ACHAW6_002743, partial [Cyclotella cf. meneghiniana]
MHISSLTIPLIAHCAKYGSASFLHASNPPLFNVTSGGYGGQLDSDRKDKIGTTIKESARPVAKKSVNMYEEQPVKALVHFPPGELNLPERNVDRRVQAGIRKLQYSNWTQLGSDIDGEAAWSGYPVSLSSDGKVLASRGNGTVQVYSFTGTDWTQLGSNVDGVAPVHSTGVSVSLSSDGKVLAVGAQFHDERGSIAGHVQVYSFTGTDWTQLGSDIDEEAAFDDFGTSVSLSSDGKVLAIGAPSNDGSGEHAGHVRVYNFTGSDWTQLGSDIDGEAAGDWSGRSVSLSSDGKVLAIGAHGNDGSGENAGHVRVYSFTGTDWTQLGYDIDGEAAEDRSGWSVSLSGDGKMLAVGAISNDGSGENAGHVRVYSFTGTDWTQLGSDIDGEAADDYSGASVSLSRDGKVLAIGAPFNSGSGRYAGHARLYSFTGTDWFQLGSDVDGEAADDRSGSSVSLSGDGKVLAIGAPYNDGSGENAGHVRVYQHDFLSTSSPSPSPSKTPTESPTKTPSASPTKNPTASPTKNPTASPTKNPTASPTKDPTASPTMNPTSTPTKNPIVSPTKNPNPAPSQKPTANPNVKPTVGPTANPTAATTKAPTKKPTPSVVLQSSNWTQLGSDIDGEAASDTSGYPVSLSSDGKVLAIRAPGNGTVRVYSFTGMDWTQLGSDVDEAAPIDSTCVSISLSSDGKVLAVGGNDGRGSFAGYVRVYSFTVTSVHKT